MATLMHDYSPAKLTRIEAARRLYDRAIEAAYACRSRLEQKDIDRLKGCLKSSASPVQASRHLDSPCHNGLSHVHTRIDHYERCGSERQISIRPIRRRPLALRHNSAITAIQPLNNIRNFSRPLLNDQAHSSGADMAAPSALPRSLSVMQLGSPEDLASKPGFFSPIVQGDQCASTPATPPQTPTFNGPVSNEDGESIHTVSQDSDGSITQSPPRSPDSKTSKCDLRPKAPDQQATALLSYSTNASSLISQLQIHLTALRALETKTRIAQSERAAKRLPQERSKEPAEVADGDQDTTRTKAKAKPKTRMLQQSRSYWSFGDAGAKDAEKARRIEEGRARGWERREGVEGYVERYTRLAEVAMRELGLEAQGMEE